jgi:hypothetical protein
VTNRRMAVPYSHYGTLAGTAGGTLLATVANIHSSDVIKTSILAAIGAVVSFLVSVSLRWLAKRRYKRSDTGSSRGLSHD